MADILYPGPPPAAVPDAVAFDAFDGPDYARALELARRSPVYRERVEDGVDACTTPRSRPSGARALRDLFQIVGRAPGHRGAGGRQARPVRAASCGCRCSGCSSPERRRVVGLERGPRPPREVHPPAPDRVGEVLQRDRDEAAGRPADQAGGADPPVRERRDPQQHRALPLPEPGLALQHLHRAVGQAPARDGGGPAGRACTATPLPLRPRRRRPGDPGARRPRPGAGRRTRCASRTRARTTEAVRTLFDQFLEARKQAGESGRGEVRELPEDHRPAGRRASSPRRARQAVDFRLETKDGKVSLKAKPVR